MSAADIIILVVLAIFVWKGIKLGLIESVGGILGLFVGAFIAGLYYDEAADLLVNLLFGSEILANIIGFLLVFILVNRAIALLFWVIDKIFDILSFIPFLKTFNHLLGGIFGLIEGILFVGIIVFFLSILPFNQNFEEKMQSSRFAPILKTVGKLADPFIPDNPIPIPTDFEALDLGEIIDKNFKSFPEVGTSQ